MNKFIFCALLLSILSGSCLQGSFNKISDESVVTPPTLTAVKLLHDQHKFIVSDEKGFHEIENCWLDSDLRRLLKNEEALHKFLEVSTIRVSKDEDGQYVLKSHVRGPGGLFVSATVCATWTGVICANLALTPVTAPFIPFVAVGGTLTSIGLALSPIP